jgi:hypothetical protein
VRLPVIRGTYLVLLALFRSLMAWRLIPGTDDVWAHAAVGRWIWDNQRIPRHSLFLWTSEEPWVAHSWLSALALYGFLSLGVEWVRIAVIVLALAPFAIIWRCWQKQNDGVDWPALLFMIAIACSASRFQARAELLSALFLACLLTTLVTWRDTVESKRNHGRSLGLFGLMALWVNCHGLAPIGVAILFATALCELVQTRGSRHARILTLTSGLGAAALLVNPYGIGIFEALQGTSSETFKEIREWRPVWEPPTVRSEIVLGTASLTLLAFLAWVVNPGRRWAHLSWLVLLAICYLSARRFTWMLNLTSLAVIAANVGALSTMWRKHEQPGRPNRAKTESAKESPNELRDAGQGIVLIVLVFAIIAAMEGLALPPPGVEPRPESVSQFIRDMRIPGRLFNDYENSSYFQWQFAGNPSLFIDLLNAYPDSVFRDYNRILDASPKGVSLLDDYGVGYVVLTNFRPGRSLKPLADYLSQSPGWVQIYGDLTAQVWVRRTPEYEYLWRPVLNARRQGSSNVEG